MHASVSTCVLEYSGLTEIEELDEDAELGPAVRYSSAALVPAFPFTQYQGGRSADAHPGHVMSHTEITITNMLDDVLDVSLETQSTEDAFISQHLALQVLSRASNEPLSQVELRPSEEIEVRIRALLHSVEPRSESEQVRLELSERLQQDGMLMLGWLRVQPSSNGSAHALEVIPVCGGAGLDHESAGFELSTHRMHFQSALRFNDTGGPEEIFPHEPLAGMRQSFTIRNLSQEPLSFDISIEDDNEAIELLITPASGLIGSEAQLPVSVAVQSWDSNMISGNDAELTIMVCSGGSSTGHLERIYVVVNTEGMEAPSPSHGGDDEAEVLGLVSRGSFNSDMGQVYRAPEVKLRGCTPLHDTRNCFEVNIGQRVRDEGTTQWELTLENVSPHALDWCFVMCDPSASSWLSLSRLQGSLSSQRESAVSVMLTLSTSTIGAFSTYLQLLNSMAPSDVKVVKVSMEVVSQNQLAAEKDPFFAIGLRGATGSRTRPVINLPNAQHGHLYHDRSFVIRNTASAPLQFFLSTDLRPERSASELFFSLSSNSVRKFKSITIEPHGQQRVYIYYRPLPAMGAATAGSVVKETICIFINCRLIKDHHKVVVLEAAVVQPLLRLSTVRLTFMLPPLTLQKVLEGSAEGLLSWPDPEADIELCQSIAVDIHGQVSEDTEGPEVLVKHVMNFFTVTTHPNSPSTQHTKVLQVHLNVDALRQHQQALARDQFAEEHFHVYNTCQPHEKHLVHARIMLEGPAATYTRSAMRTDTFDVGSAPGMACQKLELAVVAFLQQHHTLWSEIFESVNDALTAAAVSGSNEALALTTTVLTEKWADEKFRTLFLDYCYLTDELLYYALKGQVSNAEVHPFVGPLCSLLYSSSLCNIEFSELGASFKQSGQAPPLALSAWVDQLSFLLSFFPDNRSMARPLFTLLNSLDWAKVEEPSGERSRVLS